MIRLVRRVGPAFGVLFLSFILTSFVGQGVPTGPGGPAPSGCEANPPASAEVAVARVAQEEVLWCWAAAGQMTMNFVHPTSKVTQCDQVTTMYALKTNNIGASPKCCVEPRGARCKHAPGFPNYAAYGFDYIRTDTTEHPNSFLEWNEIRTEIGCKKRPFAFAWRHLGLGGHMLVAVGYETVNGQRFVIAINPRAEAAAADDAPDTGDEDEVRLRYTYEGYRDGTTFDRHMFDYYAISFRGAP